jgi:hypothetical protein
MEIGEIIGDAIKYPLNNMKALLVYIVLSIIAALVIGFTGAGALGATKTTGALSGGLTAFAVIGFIIALCVYLLIEGFMLDVIKFGINKDDGAPGIDITRQIINGIKYIIVTIVYFIIPIILYALLAKMGAIGAIISLIIFIVFALAFLMGVCRLAETESLGTALNIPEAVKDISKVGFVKILAIIIVTIVLALILGMIVSIFGTDGFIGLIGAIINAICTTYLLFFTNRAIGLAYSDA